MRHLFLNSNSLLNFVFDPTEPRLRCNSENILKESGVLSSGEQVLVRISLDLWDQSIKVGLTEMIQRLDDDNFENAMRAIRILRPAPCCLFDAEEVSLDEYEAYLETTFSQSEIPFEHNFMDTRF